ncbi:hypothetical protein [Microbacterium sp.]|uniref:hypothetical protein n=1 Tax=Microbacterium sp. TaxID=51671 RepID=UPI0035B34CEA
MTLIVANIYDDDRIAMASDTLVTWDAGERLPTPGTEELGKIVIVRPLLAIGISGYDPHGRIRDVIAMREEPLDEIIAMLQQDSRAGFVVGSLDPLRLVVIDSGTVSDRTEIGQAWSGDKSSYSAYQEKFQTEWVGKKQQPVPFRQMTALQWQTSFNVNANVGGRTLRVAGGPLDTFHFLADQTVSLGSDDRTVFLVGTGSTPGAYAFFDQNRGVGGLFCHEMPDVPVSVEASTPSEFQQRAQRDYSQEIAYARAW